MNFKLRRAVLAALLVTSVAYPQNYRVSDIRVEGLQYLSPSTVFATLGADASGNIEGNVQDAIKKLYATGLFKDVSIQSHGNVLVVNVIEQPVIADITFTNNKDVKDSNMREMLRKGGVYEGQLYSPGTVYNAKSTMHKAYETRGKYGIKVDVITRELPRNRIALDFVFSEGKTAKLRDIQFTGNEKYSDRRINRVMHHRESGIGTMLSGRDKYDQFKMDEDTEAIESFYKDRGYMKAEVNYSAASITEDRENLYVDFSINEGERYRFGEYTVVGNFKMPEEELLSQITYKKGKYYKEKHIKDTVKAIQNRLGDDGYALARVNAIPDIDEENKIVNFTFAVDAGERSYVRRINIVGNERTQDNVFRREIRQMEGSIFVTRDIDRSKIRIQRLPHVEEVDVQTEQIDNDQVDLTYKVKERGAGSVTFGLSYGQESKFGINAGFEQPNFMGTGHYLALNADHDDSGQYFSISYTNPYFTPEGLSVGGSLSYRKEKHDYNDTGSYLQDGYRIMLHFGYPLTEYVGLNWDIGYEKLKHRTTSESPREIIEELGGECYAGTTAGIGYCGPQTPQYKTSRDLIRTAFSVTRDTRNRTVFASQGALNQLTLSGTLPGSADEFYALHYKHQSYFELFDSDDIVFTLRGDLMSGHAYGKTDKYPFYENFYAGGLRTVRGYRGSSLGPRFENGDSRGGAFRANATAEFVMKMPGFTDNNNIRWSAFFDAGQVSPKAGDFEFSDMRYSAGISFVWISPMGPLSFSYAQPIKKKAHDRTQRFQFAIGVPF